jgi:hypothetical protein
MRQRTLAKTHTVLGKHHWIVQQMVDACVELLGISEVDIRAIGEVECADQYEVVLWNHRRLLVAGEDVFKHVDQSHQSAPMRRRGKTYDSLTQSSLW